MRLAREVEISQAGDEGHDSQEGRQSRKDGVFETKGQINPLIACWALSDTKKQQQQKKKK